MKIIVNPHDIEIIKEESINEKEINISHCEFEFDERITDEFTKDVYFTYNGDTYKIAGIQNNKCDYPPEILEAQGVVEVGVVAYYIDENENETRYNPRPAYFNTWEGSLKTNSQNSQPITPSEMEQFEQRLNEGLAEVANVDIKAERMEDGVTVSVTDRTGETTTVNVYDGQNGADGEKGDSGIVIFSIDNNGHLIAESESASNYENYEIGNDGHLYLEIGE